MKEVGRFIDEAFKISLDIQKNKGKKLKEFKTGCVESKELHLLKDEVHKFACQFDIPGFDVDEIDI